MSLPAVIPAGTVRRIFCEDCARLCETTSVSEVRPGLRERAKAIAPPLDPRWLTLPAAALAVWAILGALNGDDAPPASTPSAPAANAKPEVATGVAKANSKQAKAGGRAKAAVPGDAQLIAESTFSLALPAGWDRIKPAAGATFAAISPDGAADATLWITNDPKLDFAAFEASSLAQLESLAGSARVVERSAGPSVETTSVTLAPKGAPGDSPSYEVVLRGSGGNWYYLATTSQPSAPADAVEGVELIQGSFLPLGGGR